MEKIKREKINKLRVKSLKLNLFELSFGLSFTPPTPTLLVGEKLMSNAQYIALLYGL